MNKRIIYIMLMAVLLPTGVWSQTGVQYGCNLYKQFLSQINGGNPSTAYATLWQSYEALKPEAKTVSAGSAEYNQLRTTLSEMRPWIEKAYIYNASQRQRTNAMLFAQAYLDIQMMPVMAGTDFERSSNYPLIAYNAAANTYNSGDYQRVIPYFKAYLSTGEQKHRRDVLSFMMDACVKAKDYTSAKEILDEVVNNNPSNINVL